MPGQQFKQTKDFESRKVLSERLKTNNPDLLPLIIERNKNDLSLSDLKNCKFLVPKHHTMMHIYQIIRKSQLNSIQAIFILVNDRTMVSLSQSISEIYDAYKDEDGFLYMTYASEQTFG